jgi:ribosomal protein S18 acetylase RimI-like enzyme
MSVRQRSRPDCDYRVRRGRAEDWAKLRDLRIEMLGDTPKAFLETGEHARARPASEWRRRAAEDARAVRSIRCVAETPAGDLVATMGCYADARGRATVFSVYVTPAWRARGVAEALLEVVERWAVETLSAGELSLLVHEDNPRARAFYRRVGFVETGRSTAYELDPEERELEMARPIRA